MLKRKWFIDITCYDLQILVLTSPFVINPLLVYFQATGQPEMKHYMLRIGTDEKRSLLEDSYN